MSPAVVRVVVSGAAGRMGQRIIALAQTGSQFQVVYGLERPGVAAMSDSVPIGSDLTCLKNAHVVIDFSSPTASLGLARAVTAQGIPIVIGTTGFTEEQRAEIPKILREVPFVWSPNMSLAMNVFFKLAERAAHALASYSVQIVETHHVHKKDAPSGTALQVGRLIEQVGHQKVEYESVREGEVVGDHRVIFSGPQERLELFHHAVSRDTFAEGALVAAQWVIHQKPGFYTMADVLDLNAPSPRG